MLDQVHKVGVVLEHLHGLDLNGQGSLVLGRQGGLFDELCRKGLVGVVAGGHLVHGGVLALAQLFTPGVGARKPSTGGRGRGAGAGGNGRRRGTAATPAGATSLLVQGGRHAPLRHLEAQAGGGAMERVCCVEKKYLIRRRIGDRERGWEKKEPERG